MILDPQPFRIDDMLRGLSPIVAAETGARPIGLRFDVDPALPRHLVGDVARLRQLLGELCGDAVGVTGKTELALSVAVIQRSARAVAVEFAVHDAGMGSGGSDSATRQALAALMGGELKAEDVPGAGRRLRFCVTLPVARGPVDDGAAPMPFDDGAAGSDRAPERRLAGMRLLVVEDDRTNQRVARAILEAEGATVRVAANGEEAVAAVAAAEPQFDVVLMDLQMPVMDGFTAANRIRQDLGLRTLPIVAMTANVADADREACLAVGMDEHVGKPFDRRHLTAVLCRLAGWPAAPGAATVTVASVLPAGVAAAALAAGIDIAAAMSRFGDNGALYERMLSMFVEDLPAMPAQLAALVAQGEAEPALRWMHTLKGQAATLGAGELSAVAADAEQRLAAGVDASGFAAAAQMAGGALAGAGPGLRALLRALQAAAAPDRDRPGRQ